MSGLILSWPATTSEVGLGFIKRIIQFVGKEQYGSDHIIRIHHGNKIDSVTKKWTQGRTKYRITTLVPVKASHYYTSACDDFTSQTPAPAIAVMELTIPVHKELMRCVLSRMWYWICDIDVVTRTVWNLFLCVHIVFMGFVLYFQYWQHQETVAFHWGFTDLSLIRPSTSASLYRVFTLINS